MSFADDFADIVGPALRSRARRNGTLVALNIMTFADAADDLTRDSLNRGSSYLPDGATHHDELLSDLLRQIDAAEALAVSINTYRERHPSKFWRAIYRMAPKQ